LQKNSAGISVTEEDQLVQRLDTGRFHFLKGAANDVSSKRRQHFAKWAASAATSVFAWTALGTTLVT